MSNLAMIEGMSAEARTPEQNEAIFIHNQLLIHKNMVSIGLAGMCQDLKTIRDKKLYKQLGYEEFVEYTEKEHGIKERQAYKYIRAIEQYGFEFLHSSANANIGVTKLLEIAVLSHDEREQIFSENNASELSDMSTEKVKELVKEIENLKQQLNYFESLPAGTLEQPLDELDDARNSANHSDEDIERIKDEARQEAAENLKAEYEQTIQELKEKTLSEEDISKIRKDAEKEASTKLKDEIKKLKSDNKASEEKATAAVESEKKARADAELAKKAAAESEHYKTAAKAAEEEKERLERQIKLSANPALTEFKFKFDAAQESINNLLEQFERLDAEDKPNMTNALNALKESIKV